MHKVLAHVNDSDEFIINVILRGYAEVVPKLRTSCAQHSYHLKHQLNPAALGCISNYQPEDQVKLCQSGSFSQNAD